MNRALVALLLCGLSACGEDDGTLRARSLVPVDDAGPGADAVPIAPTAPPTLGGTPPTDAPTSPPTDAPTTPPTDAPTTPPTEPPSTPGSTPSGDAPGNAGWVGASCADDADCDFADAFCLGADEGWPNGTCSLDCDRICPDRAGASVTFCVPDVVVGGACLQQCDFAAYPGSGCRPGYGCRTSGRFGQPEVRREVCLPGEVDLPPDLPCDGELARRGLAYTPAENPMDHPDGRPDLTCNIEGPVRLNSPMHGVSYRYVENDAPTPMFMSCQLALAMDDLAAYLSELGIVEVAHIGTYNCREIAGSDSLSMHGLGLALDIASFTDADGVVYSVLDDWEDGVEPPRTEKGILLYEVAHQMIERGLFNIVLTPEYNAAHDNHFHIDLTPGANFLGRGFIQRGYIGPNTHGE